MTRPIWTHSRQPEPDDCDALDPLLSLYADGLASPDESRRIEDHLPACADCRQSLLWMQATHRALSQRPVVLPPADLRSRIAQSIAASAASVSLRPSRVFVLRPAFAAAASLTLVGAIVGYGLWKPHAATVTTPRSSATVAVVPQMQPLSPSVTPLLRPSPGHSQPRPPLVKHVPHSDEHVASSSIETPDDIAVAPPISHATARKPDTLVLTAVKPHPPILRRKPVLAPLPPSLVAILPKSSPAENNALKISSPEVRRPEVRTPEVRRPEVVAKAPDAPVPSLPAKTDAPTIPAAPPVVVASLPKTGEGHFQTAGLLSSVHEYVLVHQTSYEHKLSLAGSTAIRATVHSAAVTTGTDGQEAKIPAIWTP